MYLGGMDMIIFFNRFTFKHSLYLANKGIPDDRCQISVSAPLIGTTILVVEKIVSQMISIFVAKINVISSTVISTPGIRRLKVVDCRSVVVIAISDIDNRSAVKRYRQYPNTSFFSRTKVKNLPTVVGVSYLFWSANECAPTIFFAFFYFHRL